MYLLPLRLLSLIGLAFDTATQPPQPARASSHRRRRPEPIGRVEDSADLDFLRWRGGATNSRHLSRDNDDESKAYSLLARALQERLSDYLEADGSGAGSLAEKTTKVVKAFQSLSASQQAFKGLDGAAHEAYQRTHSSDSVIDTTVSGRAKRSAARASACADGLGACELIELVEHPERFKVDDFLKGNHTLGYPSRTVLLNTTIAPSKVAGGTDYQVKLLVLYEPSYSGGVGIEHGGIGQDEPTIKARGRILVLLGDIESNRKLDRITQILDQKPKLVRIGRGGSEVSSVQPTLYKVAGSVLEALEPHVRSHNASAFHFVGRSLAGGVSSLAAAILDGRLTIPGDNKKRKKKQARGRSNQNQSESMDDAAEDVSSGNEPLVVPLSGLGKDRTSAVTLGAPPCMSANVQAEFVVSILYGDDVVFRTSQESIDRLLKRTSKALKSAERGGIIGRQMNRMTDTLSLATSNLKSHAHGSEGEEARLTVPGRAFLIRPRRLGGGAKCSMHEVGSQLKGGREALRAVVLWQLNDMLLSRSMWKHHEFESYVHGIDKVQLRGFDDGDDYE